MVPVTFMVFEMIHYLKDLFHYVILCFLQHVHVYLTINRIEQGQSIQSVNTENVNTHCSIIDMFTRETKRVIYQSD